MIITGAMKHVIHKYSNRRLYDVTVKKVITLSELRKLVEEGEEVVVLDKKTGEDITDVTLAKAVLKDSQGNRFSSFTVLIKEVFTGKAGFRDFLRTSFSMGWGMFTFFSYKTRQFLSKLVASGELSRSEGEKILKAIESGKEEDPDLKELIEKVLKEAFDELGIPSKGEIRELRREIEELRKQLEELKGELRGVEN